MLGLVNLYLPTLFPSWRFFEEIGPSPRIEVRTGPETPWKELWPLPVRLSVAQYLQRLFYNPHWNHRLFMVSTAIRQTTEPSDHVLKELTEGVANALPSDVIAFEYRVAFLARDGEQIGKFIEFESGPIDRTSLQ